jgi:thiol-disulfide isomerase/thioredoxin
VLTPTVLATAFALCLASLTAAAGEILNIGDDAPPFVVSGWVKGEPVERLEPGQTAVVEFWATWCEPCRESIPHLTEMAHKFKEKGVKFIGVDAFEQDVTKVKPFVEEMGARMDYSVALDRVPERGRPGDGIMATTWMMAAVEYRIPTAFVVRGGKIAWIGHPMEMDEPLARIVAGEWDPKALAQQRLVEKTREREATSVERKINPPYSARDYKATLAAIAEATAADPKLAAKYAPLKFAALCNGGEVEEGLALGTKLLERYKDQDSLLKNTFWKVIDLGLANDPDPRVARLALKAVRRAMELSKGENDAMLDVLAVALYRGELKIRCRMAKVFPPVLFRFLSWSRP